MIVNISLVVLTVLIIVQTYIDGKAPPRVELVRPASPARAPSTRIRYEPPTRPTKGTIRFSRGKK